MAKEHMNKPLKSTRKPKLTGELKTEIPTVIVGGAVRDGEDFCGMNAAKETPAVNNSVITNREIAIVGMACRFPGAKDYEEFWENLSQGKSNIQEIPQERWDWKEYWGDPQTEKNKTNCKWGGFIEQVDCFDAEFFGLTALEVETMDPQQRMMLELTWSCLEDAGICPSQLSGERVGVFTGIANLDYKELQEKELSPIATHYATGIAQSVIANRISYWFNFKGPSFPLDTACASALTAIHMAVQSLQRGECDMALAGGVSLLLTPPRFICFSKIGLLSPTGSCNTFDDSADGTVRGEGAGLVLLKPLDKALAEGDRIYGVLKGSAVNHSGKTHTLTYPNPEAQREVIVNACLRAGITPDSISYIETHGTGTPKGDPLEFKGLTGAFQDLALQSGIKLKSNYCGLGAVKTSIGHLEAASGIASVIKVLLALKYKQLPGIHNFKQLNHRISLQDTPFYINKELQDWTPPRGKDDHLLPRRAGVSAFGFAGANAHVVIEEAPEHSRPSYPEFPWYLICLSAKTEAALRRREEDLAHWLEKQGQKSNLADISATLMLGREHFGVRSVLVVQSVPELREKLNRVLQDGNAEGYFKTSNQNGNEEVLSAGESVPGNGEEALGDVETNRQEYYSRLIGLAELYVKGYNPNWKALYSDRKIQRIALPTYPFALEHYWVAETEDKPMGNASIPAIHPLLHQNTSNIAEQRFTSEFTGQEFFLTDHLVKGKRFLPGVAYLEMARAAVEQATAVLPGEKPQICLQNIVWARPIVAGDRPVQVHISLCPDQERIVYEIYSQSEGNNAELIVHSQGNAVLNIPRGAPTLDITALLDACNRTVLSADQLYESFKGMGLDYGPAHRGIEQVFVGENQALAKLNLPSAVIQTQDQFILHPSLMDSALQVSVGLKLDAANTLLSGGNNPPRLSLPFALEELVIYDKCTANMWVHIHPSAESSGTGDGLEKLDIDLSDEQGKVRVRMRGLMERVLETELQTAVTCNAFSEPLVGTVMLTPVIDSVQITEEQPSAMVEARMVIVGGTQDNWNVIRRFHPNAAVLNLKSQDTVESMVKQLEPYGTIDHIFWVVPDNTAVTLVSDALIEEQNRGVLQIFRMIKALLQLGYDARDICWSVITTQTQPIYKNDAVNPTHASIHGLIGSMAKEYPNWKVRLVDLEADCEWPMSAMFNLPPDPRGDAWIYREQQWYRQKMIPMRSIQSESTGYRQGGVYVVIGGAGGIGEVWSEYMLTTYRAQIVWIGRREKDEAIQTKLDRLAKLGVAPCYITADATNHQALQKAYAEIKERFGRINGVIHSAIVLLDKSLANMEEERFQAGLAAQVDVSVRLAQVFQTESLDFVLFFSSMIAFVKSPGQSNYASGCTFKDAFAYHLSKVWSCAVKVVNWGYWGTVGVVASPAYQERMAREGLGSIEPPEAMAALEKLLAGPRDQIALLKMTKPQVEGVHGDELLEFYPETLPAQNGSLSNHQLDQSTRIELIKTEVIRPRNEMEAVLCKLLCGQLQSIGLFTNQQSHSADTKIKAGLSERFGRWLAESIALLVRNHYLQHRDGAYQLIDPAAVDLTAAWDEWERKKGGWLENPNLKAQVALVEATVRALPEILTGNVAATDIMFPNSSMELVEGVYKNNILADYFNEVLADTVVTYIEERIKQDPSAKIGILEIGAGTGGTSVMVLKKLRPYRDYIQEYCYTDISKAFLLYAQNEYGADNPYLTYQLFNVEAPIAGQGVVAGGYDVVIAANVLHATKNIRYTLRNAKAVIKHNGLLMLNEISGNTVFAHLTFGLLEGWWLYEDTVLRIPGCPGLSPKTWRQVLEDEGYRSILLPAQEADDLGQQIITAQSDGVVRQKKPAEPPVVTPKRITNKQAPEMDPAPVQKPMESGDHLVGKTSQIVKQTLSQTVKLPLQKIDSDTSFEKYGIDSILQVNFIKELEKITGELPKTILFEYPTSRELVDFLVKNRVTRLQEWFASSESGERAINETNAVDSFLPLKAKENRFKNLQLVIHQGSEPERAERFAKQKPGPMEEAFEDIAIIGISGRYPLANNLDQLWENLKAGHNCITEVPGARWQNSLYEFLSKEPLQKSAKKYYGGFLEQYDRFDYQLFGVTQQQVMEMPPEARLFLEIIWETFEDAGYNKLALQDLQSRYQRGIGVFVGAMYSQYPWSMPTFELAALHSNVTDWQIANRASHFFNLTGPSISINTACSSSLTAIHLACESLRLQSCSMAIAGGVNLTLDPSKYESLQNARFLGSGDRSKSFGAGDGCIPGEGVGAVLLKPLSMAIKDHDRIDAVIKSSFANHSGGRQGYTAPDPKQQAQLILDSIKRAGIDPSTISYIESAANGSELGDPIEFIALNDAFRQYTAQQQYCAIGSVKSNLGHLEAASGISQLSKVLLQLKHQTLAPTINANPRNPNIHLENSPFYLQETTGPWEAPKDPKTGKALPRRSMINSFGAGGSYTNLIIEEYGAETVLPMAGPSTRPEYLMIFSARTEGSLRRYLKAIQEFLIANTALEMGILERSVQKINHDLEYRVALVVSSPADLLEKITQLQDQKSFSDRGIYTAQIADSGLSDADTVNVELALEKKDLRQLARYWADGATVDYRQLNDLEGPVIQLPKYAFDHEVSFAFHPEEARVHQRMNRGIDSRMTSEIYAYDEPYLKDHTVYGEQVLLGATYASMAINAFFEQFPQETSLQLHRLEFVKPVVVKEGQRVTVQVDLWPRMLAHEFRVVARFDSTETWELAATGDLQKANFEARQIDIKGISGLLEQYTALDRIYGANPVVAFGDSFKTLTQLHVGKDIVLARVDLGQISQAENRNYIVHPLIINSAFLATTPWIEGQMADLEGYVPFGIKDINFQKCRPMEQGWLLVKLVKHSAELVVFDADLINDESQVVACFSGCSFKRLRPVNPFLEAEPLSQGNPDCSSKPMADQTELPGRIQKYLINKLARHLGNRSRLSNVEVNFMDLGLGSLQLVTIAKEIEKETNIELYPTLFFEYPNIKELTAFFSRVHPESFQQQLEITVDPSEIPGLNTRAAEPTLPQFSWPTNPMVSQIPGVSNRLPFTEPFQDAIAVIGMHGQFAEAVDLNQFWNNLCSRKDLIREIPVDHWDYRPWYDENRAAKDKTYCKWGSFIEDVDKFDADFFNISPREAEWMDPQLRLLLQSIYATGEDAGDINQLRGTNTGVFIGVCFHDYADRIAELDCPMDPYSGTGNKQTIIANRISFTFDLTGPSLAIDTACSSSLFALHYACNAIRNKECNMAFVGGVNLLLSSDHYRYFSSVGALSPTGRCHTFDEAADGYVPGEGVASILLKPLREAERDGDHIYAVIKGSAALHGGYTPSLTAPSITGQEKVIVKAWEDAGINPEDLGYIEAHGTGTKLGDPIEIESLKKAFRRFTNKEQFCAIGSAKAHIGHVEGAAGIAGVIKVILQIKQQRIPAMPEFKQLNPYIQLDQSPVYINRETAEWNNPSGIPRLAGVSSFGFAGTNAHVVVEEYIPVQEKAQSTGTFPPTAIIVLSAKNRERLHKQAEQLLQAFQTGGFSDSDLADIAYTLQLGREAMEERLAMTVASFRELTEKLQGYLDGRDNIEGVYSGQIKRNKDTFAVLTVDEDLQKAIEAWIAKGKYAQLLELWVKGLSFDWNRLYDGGRPRYLSLPTYPFAKERYWLPDMGIKTLSHPISPATASIHPLLHQNTSNFAEQRFTSAFTGREFFLTEQVMTGERFLSGMVCLEMIRAAVEQATADGQKAETRPQLQNVSWDIPIVINATGVRVHIGLYLEDDRIMYEIYSQPEEDNTESIVYCQGTATLNVLPEHSIVDLGTLKAQCSHAIMTNGEIYETLKATGLSYDPAQQGIEELYLGPEQGLAKLVLPSSLNDTHSSFVLHPSAMEAALQATVGLLTHRGLAAGKPIFPVALAQLDVFNSGAPVMWVSVRYCGDSASGLPKLDLDFYDEVGNIWVRMRGLEVKENTEIMAVNTIAPTNEPCELMTFAESWEEQASADYPPMDLKSIICFFSDVQEQQAATEAIQTLAPGVKVIFIAQGADYQKYSPQLYQIAATDRNNYQEAFRNIKEDHGDINVVFYMWPLEDQRYIQDTACIVRIIQAIAVTKLNPSRLCLVGQYNNTLERCYLESWIGFERSLGLVLPHTRVAAVISDNEKDPKLAIKAWLSRLMAEIRNPKAQSVLFQAAQRYICQIKPIAILAGNSLLKPGATYLITGGCGGLGILFAKHLAKTKDINLILTGRSALDPEKQSQIKQLEDLGAQVLYLQADVCDAPGMKEALSLAKERFKVINGLIHAAGIEGHQSILENDLQSFQKVLDPKIKGALTLDTLLQDEPLDFVCYFSSSAAILGDFGTCDYAVGNRFLMAYAYYRNQQPRSDKTIVINWPFWKEGGMGNRGATNAQMYLKSSGQRSLETAEGLDMFDRLLAQQQTQYLVLAGQPARVHRFLGLVQETTTVLASHETPSSSRGRRPEMKGLSLEQCLEWDLKEHISKLLKISRHKLDKEENLAEFGFDSIMLAQFATVLTGYYRIEITPSLFFAHSTIEKLIQYLMVQHQSTVQAFYQEDAVRVAPRKTPPTKVGKVRKQWPTIRKPVESSPEVSVLEPIAIIGMSGRFPGARSVEEMWTLLAEDQDMVREIPPERFDWRKYYGDPNKEKGKTNCKWCGCIPGVGEFDPRFFEITPREAESMDPRQRLLLQESWNALEDAGYGPKQIKTNKIGMFVGVEQGDYQLVAKGQGNVTSNHNAILASRLAYFLNLNGPVMALDTACSSGLVAAHQACQSLRNLECDTAIVAGINLLLNPASYIMASQAGMLSEDGKCFAFDKRANGMVPGEAVAVVVLKRLSRAEADQDPIYAVIQGSAINYDGKTNGITAPSGAAQTSLLKTVYDQYQVNPEEIEHIVAHGTGTKLGDSVEINALVDAFKDYTSKQGFCALTSVKTNLGHTFAASGLVSLVDLVQSLNHELIPASLHCEQENDYINWQASPFYVNKTKQPWLAKTGKDRVGAISAFGMSGTNAHMVLRSYAQNRAETPSGQPPYYLLTLSARTREALAEKVQSLSSKLQHGSLKKNSLLQISYTLLEGRQHFNHRCAIVVQDCDNAVYVWGQIASLESPPNLFQGVVQRDFKVQKLMQQYGEDLLKQSGSLQADPDKYQEILYVLADLYCQGYELDWSNLYPDPKPRRISLPTYPFAKEYYWIKELDERKPVDSVANQPVKPVIQSEVPQRSVPTPKAPKAEAAGLDQRDQVSLMALANYHPARELTAQAHQGIRPISLTKVPEAGYPVAEPLGQPLKLTAVADRAESAKPSDANQPGVHARPTVSLEVLRENLQTSLAEILRVNPDEIAVDIEFTALGLDSITGVEWIQAINEQYGTSLQATRIYDYPTVGKMADHLLVEIAMPKEEVTQVLAPNEPPMVSRGITIVRAAVSAKTLQEELKISLAEVLRMTPDELDVDQEFSNMGLDSIAGVEWIQAVNGQFGTSIQATRIYDYPNIRKMADYLILELSMLEKGISEAAASDEGLRLEIPPANAQPDVSVETLREALKISLAELLRMNPDEIEMDVEFTVMGIDSITGVEWIQAINRQYGTSIQATKIYDYSTVNQMADYLLREMAKQQEFIQASPLKSPPSFSVDQILEQLKNGSIDSEEADRLLSKVMGV